MSKVKITVIIIVLILIMTFAVGCNNEGTIDLELPNISIEIVDGDSIIELTNVNLSGVTLDDFSITRNDETSYFKGIKVSNLLNLLAEIEDQEEIESLLFVAVDGYGEEQTALPKANFNNAYLALLFSETEDGEFELLSEANGPVRLYDTTQCTDVKSIKQVARIVVAR